MLNIRDVNLRKLADKLVGSGPLSADDIALVNRILFSDNGGNLSAGDVVMVLGNPTCLEDRIVKAVEIMQKSMANYILLSGGVFLPQSIQTEALGMYDFCIHSGIPKEKILIENESTTTRENIILSAPIIEKLNLVHPKIIVVSSASHMRRVKMNIEKFKMLFPENATFTFVPSIHSSCNPSDWFLYEEARKTVSTELQLIECYISEYHYSSFEI